MTSTQPVPSTALTVFAVTVLESPQPEEEATEEVAEEVAEEPEVTEEVTETVETPETQSTLDPATIMGDLADKVKGKVKSYTFTYDRYTYNVVGNEVRVDIDDFKR